MIRDRNRRALGCLVFILAILAACGLAPPDTDDSAGGGRSTPAHNLPSAEAGADLRVPTDAVDSIALDGSNSQVGDGPTLTFRWFCSHEGVRFTPNERVAAPTASLPGPGVYVIFLVVNDGIQPSAPDFLTVTVEAPGTSVTAPPLAEAGPDQSVLVTEADNVFLDGSQSFDPDGDPLDHQWYCSDASAIFSAGADVSQPTVSLPGAGICVFALVVEDGELASEPDFLTVTVEAPDAWVDSGLPQDIPAEQRYRTIQAAIDAVADGTDRLIAVHSGPYDEQVVVANRVRLYGMRQADGLRARPLIRYPVAQNEAVVVLNANAGLDSLHIAAEAGPGDPSQKSVVHIQGTGAEIIRCRIEDTKSDGVQLAARSGMEIRATALERVLGEGIVADAGSSLQVFDTRIVDTGGSAEWALDAGEVVLENTLIHLTGWHGVDLQGCAAVRVNHCSIIDFSRNDSGQAGVVITNGRQVEVTNNLIVIQALATLIGVQATTESGAAQPQFTYNYIYSRLYSPSYYAGDLDLTGVDDSNWPNATRPVTVDPLLTDPAGGDFRLQANSPAAGNARDGENRGAQGAVLVDDPD